jgi:protocatechuate 3,4-dioxygenase beta subunit
MILTGLLSFLFPCSIGLAQDSAATTSVSGRVTVAGKGAAGITVVARVINWPLENRTVAKTVTDDEGNYRLTGLAVGRFTITPIDRTFVVGAGTGFYKSPGQMVNVTENESISKIDFALVRGGVITGRISDLEGRPIIGERVHVAAKGDAGTYFPIGSLLGPRNQTDDRGVYRIYGLGPGSYKISVGKSPGGDANMSGLGGSLYPNTFYPGVTEEAKATAIEISEGAEVTDIDVTPGKSAHGFSVSGHVVDADSSQPVANAFIAYSSVNEDRQRTGQTNFTSSATDANGKFLLEGLQPGHYAAFTVKIGPENSYSDPTPFEISEGDVTGIQIKVRRGATIDGVAIVENNVDPAIAAQLQSVSLLAYVEDGKSAPATSYSRTSINPDGSFRFAGLAPGNAKIILVPGFSAPPKGLELLRTELNGLDQANGIGITSGSHIKGVRLVFSYGTGKIRGEVKIEGGVLPEGTSFALYLRSVDGDARRPSRYIEVDARRQFVEERIPPGTFELILQSSSTAPAFTPVTRRITVPNVGEVSVTLVINLAERKEGKQ